MKSDLVPFRDLLADIVDNRGKTCPTANIGIPLIATNCISNNQLYPSYEKVRYVPQVAYETWFRGHPEPGDLIFVTKGSPGRVCMVPDPVDFCIAQDMVAIRADSEKIYPNFLFALLRSPTVQAMIENMHVGTLIPHFKKGDFDKLFLPIPDRPTQKFVGDIYVLLSEKIELNRRMNETLETMARAIFKSWFVDFDPVRAKAEGRQPEGMDVATAVLFPDGFEDSELGEIPKGWKVSTIGDICEVIDCLHSKKPSRQAEGMPLLQLANIKDNGLIDMEDTYYISGKDYEKWISRMEATAGDCVITNVGRIGAVGQIPSGVKAALGRNMTGIRCKNAFPFPTFVIELLLSAWMKQEIDYWTDSGTIMNALNVRSIPKLRFIQSDRSLLSAFEKFSKPLRKMMMRNLDESASLVKLRDTLLPKLLSGEIRVKGAENYMEDAI